MCSNVAAILALIHAPRLSIGVFLRLQMIQSLLQSGMRHVILLVTDTVLPL